MIVLAVIVALAGLLGIIGAIGPREHRTRELERWNRPARELCRKHPQIILDTKRSCSVCRRCE